MSIFFDKIDAKGAISMKYVSIEKRSKREQKRFYAARRGDWNGVRPVTRSIPSGKVYDRAREKARRDF